MAAALATLHFTGAAGLALVFAVAALLSVAAAILCQRQLVFPHSPTLTQKDFFEMKSQGVPPAILQSTHDAVLHGIDRSQTARVYELDQGEKGGA